MRQEAEERTFGYNPEFVRSVQNKRTQNARSTAFVILQDAAKEASNIIANARLEAARIISNAKVDADNLLAMARLNARTSNPPEQVEMVERRPFRLVDEIVAEALTTESISVAELKSRKRSQIVANARQRVMAAIYVQRPDMSLSQIGRYLGRDHTTVLHAVQKLGVWRGIERQPI